MQRLSHAAPIRPGRRSSPRGTRRARAWRVMAKVVWLRSRAATHFNHPDDVSRAKLPDGLALAVLAQKADSGASAVDVQYLP